NHAFCCLFHHRGLVYPPHRPACGGSLATHAGYLIAVGENRICRRCEILRQGRGAAPSMLGYSGWPTVRALVSRKGWGISPHRLLIFLYRPATPQPSLRTVVSAYPTCYREP